MFDTWLIEIKIRGARPHNRRALHAACLIPRACGSLEFYEVSQATSEPPCLGLVVTIVLANRRRLHESSSSPSTESRWRFVIPHLLFATWTTHSQEFVVVLHKRCQSSQTNTHRVQLTFARIMSSVPGGSINTAYYLWARGESSYCRVITHDESKCARVAQPRAPPVRIRRPRELRAIRFDSTCLRMKSHFGGSLGPTGEKRRIDSRDTTRKGNLDVLRNRPKKWHWLSLHGLNPKLDNVAPD